MSERLIAEIEEQPAVAGRVLAATDCDAAAEALRHTRFLYLAARGSSDHAAIYAKYLFESRGRVCALAAPSLFTLYGARPELHEAGVIGISQSGAAPDVAEVLRAAREDGATTIAITNEPRSLVARTAQHVVALRAGPERSHAATKTFTATCLALARLAGASSEAAPQALAAALALRPEAERLARRVRAPVAVIGRGYTFPIALDAALKIEELGGLDAEAHSAADFAHGPIVLAGKGASVLLLAVRGPTLAPLRALALDLRRRGARVFALTDDPDLAGSCDAAVRLAAAAPEHVVALSLIVPAQLIARALALAKGRDPDRVEGFTKVTRTR